MGSFGIIYCDTRTVVTFTRFWYDLLADECFSVTQSDFLTGEDVITYWTYVELADPK